MDINIKFIRDRIRDKYIVQTYFDDFIQCQIISVLPLDQSKIASRKLSLDDIMDYFRKSTNITPLVLNLVEMCIADLEKRE